MKSQPINKFSAWIIILTLLLGWIMWGEFNRRESQLRAEQIQFLAVQPTTWAKEDAEHALAARQKSLELEKAYAQEQARALGGPIEAATKDPALDIRRMLNQIAIASAPADTEVSVTVDRFTEFDVALVLRQPLSLNEVAGITKVFLENTAPYVHSLRFIHGNEVLAQLKQDAIESITNWTAASADSIQTLLLISDTESEPRTAAMAAGDTSATQTDKKDLTRDQIKIDQAQSTFTTHYNEHAHLLQKLAHDLSQAAQLDSVKSRAQLKAQIASLDQLATRLATERNFFLHQSADLELLLKGQELDPLVVSIIKRDVENRNQEQAAILSRLFDSLSTYQQQIKTFLAGMETTWGEWAVEPGTRQIQFTSARAQDAYSLGFVPVRASAQMVENNFRSWANDKPAK